jgi:proline-specific peptidase
MTDLYANVNGIKICYEIHGNGDPIILVHGFGSKKDGWKFSQLPELSKEYKVIIFDNRGAGKSDRPNEPYTMELFADDLNILMQFLKIDKAHVLGCSLGGMIVQTFAINYPERIRKLILINTTPTFPSDKSGIEVYKNHNITKYNALMKDPTKTFFDYASPGFTRKFKKMMQENPKRKFHGLFTAEDLIKDSTINPSTPHDIINQAHALKHFNVIDRLYKIQSETLIITASHDKTLPKLMSEKIHERIPNSKLILIEGAGHSSNHEKAPEINQHILDFLKS